MTRILKITDTIKKKYPPLFFLNTSLNPMLKNMYMINILVMIRVYLLKGLNIISYKFIKAIIDAGTIIPII